MPLKEILPQLAEEKNGLSIVDKKNKILGITTPQGVLRIMASAGLNKTINKS